MELNSQTVDINVLETEHNSNAAAELKSDILCYIQVLLQFSCGMINGRNMDYFRELKLKFEDDIAFR